MVSDAAAAAVARSPLCITPSTFPKPVSPPLLVPTSPVIIDKPVFVTAPVVENTAKFEPAPSTGAWALAWQPHIEATVTATSNNLFIFLFLARYESTEQAKVNYNDATY